MRKKLGEILLATGAVTQADIDLALMDQAAGEPARLGDQLVALGKISPLQLAKALSQQHTIPLIELPRIPPEVLDAVPLEFQLRHRLVPFRVSADAVSVGMVDPADEHAVSELRALLGKRVVRYVVPSDAIDAAHAPTVELPEVAPHVAPVAGARSPPTELDLFDDAQPGLSDELFSGLDLPLPTTADVVPPPPVAPLGAPSAVIDIREEEDEPEFFESTPVVPHHDVPPPPTIAPSPPPSAPPAIFEIEPELPLTTPASEGLTSSASGSFAVDLDEPTPEAFEVSVSSGDFGPAPQGEPLPTPEPPPVPPSADDFFAASPTIPVDAAAHTVRVMTPRPEDLPFPVDEPTGEAAVPPPMPVAAPRAKESLPSWLGSEPSGVASRLVPAEWSGALDDVPPSRLIVATVRALVEKGVLTEDEILAALKKNG